MKQICHTCGAEVRYSIVDRVKKIECKSCGRCLFTPVKNFTLFYLVFTVIIAFLVWYFVDRVYVDVPYVWAVYLSIFIAIAVFFVLSMLRPIFISLYYRARQKKR